MNSAFLQVVVSVWLSSHPVTFTLPHLWSAMDHDKCEEYIERMLVHRKNKKLHMEIACERTDRRAL